MPEDFKKYAKENRLKQYDFCVQYILRNPSCNTAEIVEAWKDYGMTGKAPVSMIFAKAIGHIKKVFGISSITELPTGSAGRHINISGLIRLLLKQNPDLSASQAAEILASFGLSFSNCLFGQVKGWKTNKSKNSSGEGPRARGRGRRRGASKISHSNTSYSDLEDDLDNLIMKCRDIENSEVMEKLKDARRVLIKSS